MRIMRNCGGGRKPRRWLGRNGLNRHQSGINKEMGGTFVENMVDNAD
jgi:hypothetical protein